MESQLREQLSSATARLNEVLAEEAKFNDGLAKVMEEEEHIMAWVDNLHARLVGCDRCMQAARSIQTELYGDTDNALVAAAEGEE